MRSKTTKTGRPQPGEYAAYAQGDLDQVPGEDAVEALLRVEQETLELFATLTEEQITGLRYAPGKWTPKEILGHLADDERIFVYRALAIARGDTKALDGFDEDLYVETSGFEDRPLESLLGEYRSVRRASVTFFSGLPPEAWGRKGTVVDYQASVRGLAFHIAGHELHHLRVLRQLYLPLLP